MSENRSFYTLKGYSLIDNINITYSMEDYLEMIYRLHIESEPVRINRLSEKLNVKPSSASKMVNNLKKKDLIYFEEYRHIKLTEKGLKLSEYLISRHETINKLLCLINNTQNELEQTEKIEHYINPQTVCNMKNFIDKFTSR